MKMLRKLILLVCGVAMVSVADAAAVSDSGDAIIGLYEVVSGKDVSKVEIYRCSDGSYGGRIVWLKNSLDANGNPRLDEKNSDPELRSRRADEIVLLKDLKYDASANQWGGGTVYNPFDGNTYDVVVEFESADRLKVRGYVRKPMFGKTYYWKKLK